MLKLEPLNEARLLASVFKSIDGVPSFLFMDWFKLAKLAKFEKLNNGFVMLLRPGRFPKRLANEDSDGVVEVVVVLATVVVVVLLELDDVVELLETDAAAAAAASKNIFIDGKLESMLLLKPKFANDAAAFEKLDFPELLALNALA